MLRVHRPGPVAALDHRLRLRPGSRRSRACRPGGAPARSWRGGSLLQGAAHQGRAAQQKTAAEVPASPTARRRRRPPHRQSGEEALVVEAGRCALRPGRRSCQRQVGNRVQVGGARRRLEPSWPATAIIAALSVQRREGRWSAHAPLAALASAPRAAGVGGHAAGEHHAPTPERARRGLAHQRSTAVPGRRGQVGDCAGDRRAARRTWSATAVLMPENQKSGAAVAMWPRERRSPRGSPRSREPSIAGPPGIAQAEQLGDLVEGLARGVVARLAEQLGSAAARAPRRARCARPRRAARRTGARAARSSRKTARGGPRDDRRRRAACPGPAPAPWPPSSRRAARRPARARAVTAMPSRSASPMPAVVERLVASPARAPRGAREASSGTTPPYGAWTSTCEATTSESTTRPSVRPRRRPSRRTRSRCRARSGGSAPIAPRVDTGTSRIPRASQRGTVFVQKPRRERMTVGDHDDLAAALRPSPPSSPC